MEHITDQMLDDMVLETVKELNLEIADKKSPGFSLREMLGKKNLKTLKEIGRAHMMVGTSKMNKGPLIDALTEMLTDEVHLADFLYVQNDDQWDLFNKAVEADQYTDDERLVVAYSMLISAGYLYVYYHEDHFHYVVPKEVKTVFKRIIKDGFIKERNRVQLINAYAMAAVNLYGVISIEDIIDLFNKQNTPKTDFTEADEILSLFSLLDFGYFLLEGYLVNEDFAEDYSEDVEYILSRAETIPRYFPRKEIFLQYSDVEFIEETPQLDALRQFLQKNLAESPDWIDDLLEDIVDMCRYEAEMQEFIDFLEFQDFEFTEKNLQTYVQLIIDVKNNTRLWINNGHTPQELSSKNKKKANRDSSHLRLITNEPREAEKVGRNDPCPCGSGKKYKKCCGK